MLIVNDVSISRGVIYGHWNYLSAPSIPVWGVTWVLRKVDLEETDTLHNKVSLITAHTIMERFESRKDKYRLCLNSKLDEPVLQFLWLCLRSAVSNDMNANTPPVLD